MIKLSYDDIMRALARDSLFSITIAKDVEKEFRKQLSQRKIRLGIAGRLTFATEPDIREDAIKLHIALLPTSKGPTIKAANKKKRAQVDIFNVNKEGTLL